MNTQAKKLQEQLLSYFKFKLYTLLKLPSVFLWGVSIRALDREHCEVVIPFKYLNKNPFKSIYFAALAGAAELSTGALALLATAGIGKTSMLVTSFKADYSKKATRPRVFF